MPARLCVSIPVSINLLSNWIIFGWFPITIGIGIAVDWLTPISMVSSHNPHSSPHTIQYIHVRCSGVPNVLKNLFDFFLLRLLRCAADSSRETFLILYICSFVESPVCVCMLLADVNNTHNCCSNEHILIVVHLITTDSDRSKSSVLFNERWAIWCCCSSAQPEKDVSFFHD